MRLFVISESVNDLQEQLIAEFPELEELSIHAHRNAIYLSNIRVHKDARDKGIGTKVVERLKEYAQELGLPVLLSAEHDPRKKAPLERFYRRLGFKKPGRRRNYSLPRHTHIWQNS